jgi:hypothetical protein
MSVTSPTGYAELLELDELAAVLVVELAAALLLVVVLLLLLLPHAASPKVRAAVPSAGRMYALILPDTCSPFRRTENATLSAYEDSAQFLLTCAQRGDHHPGKDRAYTGNFRFARDV